MSTSFIIDCDVHPVIHDAGEFSKHLPKFFRETSYSLSGGFGFGNPHGVQRRDIEIRHVPGAKDWFDVFRIKLLEELNIGVAVLNHTNGYAAGVHPNPDFAVAYCRAINEYMVEHWLSADPRYTAAIMVAPQDPSAAAAEIRRAARDPRFVAVSLTSATPDALGNRRYWPIYEAACECNLPVSVHPGYEGTGMSRPFASGYAETYLEWHTCLSSVYMTQAISLVTRGVFTTFPALKFVMLEGGVAWLPHVLWRLDKNWKALRVMAPFLKEPPSHYLLNQLRLSTQPIEEPPRDQQILQIFDMIEAKRTLMFSSDFPHWDNDDPRHSMPKLDPVLSERIFSGNALETYPRIAALYATAPQEVSVA